MNEVLVYLMLGLMAVVGVILIRLLLPLWLGEKGRYKAADIMTANEVEFFHRLVEALPDHYIFPQVSLGALMRPSISRRDPEWMKQFNQVSSKRADFAIYDRKLKLVTLIELDDKSHSRSKDRERDRKTRSAGIPTLRYESRCKPDIRQIRRDIAAWKRGEAAGRKSVSEAPDVKPSRAP